jgi:hypothetical protein
MKSIIVLLFICSIIFAKDYPKVLSLYSNMEVREMANAYKAIANRSESFDPVENIDVLMKSNEFRGYVIGTLESQETLLKCAKSKSIKEIAYKSAVQILNFEPNSITPSAMTIYTGVRFACDDSMWKNK